MEKIEKLVLAEYSRYNVLAEESKQAGDDLAAKIWKSKAKTCRAILNIIP